MEKLIRLMISNERIVNNKSNNIELTNDEAHYLNKVMRVKTREAIFIINGEGSLWKALKGSNDMQIIGKFDKPYLFEEKQNLLLGIAVVIPKNGFEDTLKMCTEIGIDLIQPLYSERQINKNSNFSKKFLRWNSIIKEAVEQSERLWKPTILNAMEITDWIKNSDKKGRITISATREDNCNYLNECLKRKGELINKKEEIIWNVIGPEGGWSIREIDFFMKNKIELVKLSNNILRTSTAAINSSSILNQWRNDLQLRN